MDFIIIAIAVLIASGLTFFSGFGLGTIMLPVFSLFFDLPTAVGATAIIHLANNVFKFGMVHKYIHFQTLFRFGIPALIFAAIGGMLLSYFSDLGPYANYTIGMKNFNMTLVGTTIGSLMIFFAWFDLDPRFKKLKITNKHLPFGGALSGFFGGVSGHQGAFRSAFLSKSGLTKEQFIGTSNAVSLVVDITRLTMYLFVANKLSQHDNHFLAALTDAKSLLIVGIVFAFLGTYFGKKMVQKTTIIGIRKIIGVLLFLMGGLMIAGVL